ncbi:hypothetical protein [Micromonospora globbae]|nr:hypothetical protein [Micromonospora globbae]
MVVVSHPHSINSASWRTRIWIHSYIKGPDGAPLLLGDTVSVLAR